jgi:hypothetical protein
MEPLFQAVCQPVATATLKSRSHIHTNWMRTHSLEIHLPQWYDHEGAFAPQPYDGIMKFQCGLTFFFIILEIDVCDEGLIDGFSKCRDSITYGSATP